MKPQKVGNLVKAVPGKGLDFNTGLIGEVTAVINVMQHVKQEIVTIYWHNLPAGRLNELEYYSWRVETIYEMPDK